MPDWSCMRLWRGSTFARYVGAWAAIMKALRVSDGRFFIVSAVSTSPTDALDVSMIGVPTTCTTSSRRPTSSTISSVTNCCVPIATPVWSNVLNPASVALSEYAPAGTAGKVNSPTSFVTVVREMFVASFVRTTVAPGRTPLASLTAPRTPP